MRDVTAIVEGILNRYLRFCPHKPETFTIEPREFKTTETWALVAHGTHGPCTGCPGEPYSVIVASEPRTDEGKQDLTRAAAYAGLNLRETP
jgi:hypothetical protein